MADEVKAVETKVEVKPEVKTIEPTIQNSFEENSFDHAIHFCNEIIKIANSVKAKGKKTENRSYRKLLMEFKKLISGFKKYSSEHDKKLGRTKE